MRLETRALWCSDGGLAGQPVGVGRLGDSPENSAAHCRNVEIRAVGLGGRIVAAFRHVEKQVPGLLAEGGRSAIGGAWAGSGTAEIARRWRLRWEDPRRAHGRYWIPNSDR